MVGWSCLTGLRVLGLARLREAALVIVRRSLTGFGQGGPYAGPAIRFPGRFGHGLEDTFRRPAPALGGHTGEVLAGLGIGD
ncbi:hypothetical protein [Actinomadura macrotermitis]|uniref:Uncharacterized protein n=1 Tax=Actinomadura macrotermitis TaxID=2585200 RepID=A0A7K0C0H6_9ACTN|nr:hypothetical protein [Actinomadura macrotermitis]MQY06968.1 hypothetical protein [Actinomadura macrotermitis]